MVYVLEVIPPPMTIMVFTKTMITVIKPSTMVIIGLVILVSKAKMVTIRILVLMTVDR